MALKLRRDIQKSSYYVWFLGAEEARGLRGSRVLLAGVTNLIERSRTLEPLKVTLQVSHKGIKIIQDSSKHFITHSAITCSIQVEDIVACVLLLYNPLTKCPLHVHAYRCDSETTARDLNQLIQVLVNRSENQTRFTELESRLGLQASLSLPSPVQTTPSTFISNSINTNSRERGTHTDISVKRFESSVGSDTGTSTRESDCSEEINHPHKSLVPAEKPTLYDSLAAELRAKLNGNGPPLLLPPRDYDTVHRSKGNLAAIELRRCRNSLIVGGPKNNVSSRGSSGIGSDLAPSPERPDEQSSSDEDWPIKQPHHIERSVSSPKRLGNFRPFSTPLQSPPVDPYEKSTPSTNILRENSRRIRSCDDDESRHRKEQIEFARRNLRSVSQDDSNNQCSEEKIIKPIIRPRNSFKDIWNDNSNFEEQRDRFRPESKSSGQLQPVNKLYNKNYFDDLPTRSLGSDSNKQERGATPKLTKQPTAFEYDAEHKDEINYQDNLTDKQKFKKSLIEKQTRMLSSNRYHDNEESDFIEIEPDPVPKRTVLVRNSSHHIKDEEVIDDKYNNRYSMSPDRSYGHRDETRHMSDHQHIERNPYKEAESLPYRESIEKMIKSKAMFDMNDGIRRMDVHDESSRPLQRQQPLRKAPGQTGYLPQLEIRRPTYRKDYSDDDFVNGPPIQRDRFSNRNIDVDIPDNRSPPIKSSIKMSPKDNFFNAKQKFDAMDRQQRIIRATSPPQPRQNTQRNSDSYLVSESYDSHIAHFKQHSPEKLSNWNTEDDHHFVKAPVRPTSDHYREKGFRKSYLHVDKDNGSKMGQAKSMGNLVPGYRHSYAEPKNMPRNSGRVGLAAVNPF